MRARSSTAKGRLWKCRRCGRRFANRNQTHTCAGLQTVELHLRSASPEVKRIYRAFVRMLRAFGPVALLPEKSRIAFQVRMSFAVLMPRRNYMIGHLVLARRATHPRFTRVETFSPRNHLHAFRFDRVVEIDREFRSLAADAYAVGEQRHLHGMEVGELGAVRNARL